VIFQTYKNVVLKSIHSLGWLLWLCFYPFAWLISLNLGAHNLRGIWNV
jgi:hypothetical protein